jgi:hypothetical protein
MPGLLQTFLSVELLHTGSVCVLVQSVFDMWFPGAVTPCSLFCILSSFTEIFSLPCFASLNASMDV